MSKETNMPTYPDKLCIIAPQFRIVTEPFPAESHGTRAVFLEAWAVLIVHRQIDGSLTFRQVVEIDHFGDRSVELMRRLGYLLDGETSLGGLDLGSMLASFVRVPRGSAYEADGKEPLERLKLALFSDPVDCMWLDNELGLPTLRTVATTADLPAEWDEPCCRGNPARLQRQLAARARAMWLAIAEDRIPAGQQRWQAIADFAAWHQRHPLD